MTDSQNDFVWQPSGDRSERVKQSMLRPAEFAALTGANVGFNPPHVNEWMIFWKEDICEKDEFHTAYPQLSLGGARRVWLAMEEHSFARYDDFLRVWPE